MQFLAQLPPYMVTALALLLTMVGIYVLCKCWQNKASKVGWLLSAWLLILCACPLWVLTYGIEFGISFHLITLAIASWLTIIIHADIKPTKIRPMLFSKPKQARQNNTLSTTILILAAIFIAGSFSLFYSIEISLLLPLTQSAKMIFSALFFPFLWAIMTTVLCYSHRPHRLSIILLIATCIPVWHLAT